MVMAGMVHKVRVAAQRRKHQTARMSDVFEGRGRDGQSLSHIIAAGCEEASAEIVALPHIR